MLSIMDQLQPILKAPLAEISDPEDVRQERTLEFMRATGNVTPAKVSQGIGVRLQAAQHTLRLLKRAGKVISWRSGNTHYYGLALPVKRRR